MNVNSNITSSRPTPRQTQGKHKEAKMWEICFPSLLKRDLYFLKKNLDLAYLFAAQLGVQRNK